MKPFNKKYIKFARFFEPLWWILSKIKVSVPSHDNLIPSKILIFDFHLVGDIVMLTPFLESLRYSYPKAKIVLVAGPWAKEILFGTQFVNEIKIFNAPWVRPMPFFKGLFSCLRLIMDLSSSNWDLGIEMRGDIRQILLLWIIGPRRRVGFDFTGGASLLTDVVRDNGKYSHLIDHHQRIATHLKIWPTSKKYTPFLKLNLDELSKSSNIVPYLGFHFGASLPLRRLPVVEIKKIISKFSNCSIPLVVYCPPEDCSNLKTLLETLSMDNVTLWSGNLRDLIIMMSRAKHVICMDSGPAHIAAALGVPLSVIYGPADFEYVHPISQSLNIIYKKDMICRPCNQVVCINNIQQKCMLDLSDDYHFNKLYDDFCRV